MNANAACFASRKVSVAVAMKIAFCIVAASAGFALAKGSTATSAAPAPAAAIETPRYARVLDSDDAAKESCRQALVQTQAGQVARWVCRRTL